MDNSVTATFDKRWIKPYGKFMRLIVWLFGRVVELPSGNRIVWFKGRAYVWERRVYHCEKQHVQFANLEDETKW